MNQNADFPLKICLHCFCCSLSGGWYRASPAAILLACGEEDLGIKQQTLWSADHTLCPLIEPQVVPLVFFFLSTKRHSPAVSLCRRKHACTHVWEASYLSLQILQLSQGAGACRWWVNACFLLWCNWRVYSGGNKNVDFRLSSSDLICFSCTLNTTSTVPLTSIIFERKHISPNHISHPKQSTKRTGDKITTTE